MTSCFCGATSTIPSATTIVTNLPPTPTPNPLKPILYRAKDIDELPENPSGGALYHAVHHPVPRLREVRSTWIFWGFPLIAPIGVPKKGSIWILVFRVLTVVGCSGG